MKIGFGKKYVNIKSNEVVEVYKSGAGIYENTLHGCPRTLIPNVMYTDTKDTYHLCAVWDFEDNFKPFEPVYEYQYVYYSDNLHEWDMLQHWYTEEEANKKFNGNTTKYRQLDFTKRERK